jgi:hypothetical protein
MAFIDFEIDPVLTVTTGQKYAIVLRAPSGDGSGVGDKRASWRLDSTGSSYDDGQALLDSGEGWQVVGGTADHMFEVYGEFDPVLVTPTDLLRSKKLVAAGNNEVWYESSSGTMEVLTDSIGDIDCSLPLSMCSLLMILTSR